MPQSTTLVMPSPVAIKRLPWMRRLSVISQKLSRHLTVFSYESYNLWSFIESHPAITRFCEYPGYVIINDQPVLATFWVQGHGHQQFLVLENDIQLEPEHKNLAPTFRDASIFTVTQAWLAPHRQRIENWQQINPYIVCNGRFVTPQILDATAALFDKPIALYDAEHALQRIDQQLVRTAVFILLHKGRIMSDDLIERPLSSATLFYPSDVKRQENLP